MSQTCTICKLHASSTLISTPQKACDMCIARHLARAKETADREDERLVVDEQAQHAGGAREIDYDAEKRRILASGQSPEVIARRLATLERARAASAAGSTRARFGSGQ